MDLLRTSAMELAAMIRRREISPLEALEAHIARIEVVNPAINAVINDRFDRARQDARVAEQRVMDAAAEDLPPLHGVPCTIKSAFSVRDMPWDVGLSTRRGLVADVDAPTVACLREAGAICMGLTNVPEGLMWYETYNTLYGRTGNPYDPGRTAGGSSGGEGSIIGAGASPFGLGSDVAGSIRLPAYFCGVFGHKSSGGRISNAGQYPPTEGPRNRILATGPLARRAGDLLPLVRLLADPNWSAECTDGDHSLRRRRAIEEGDLRGTRVFVTTGNGLMPVQRHVRGAIEAAGEALEARGAVVERWRHPSFRRSLELWLALLDETDGWTFAEILGNGTPIGLGREMLRKAVGRSPHISPSLALAGLEKMTAGMAPGRMKRLADEGRALKADLDDRLGDDGVLLFPTFPRTAMKHRVAMLRPYEFAFTAIFNALRLPSTQVPLGLDRKGLPMGTQVVGAEGRDALTMAVGCALEKEFGGWVWPEGL
jgi:fatty acid amide hydrolase 2